jgi:alginate O-acetyltransferase complex protein AlgI
MAVIAVILSATVVLGTWFAYLFRPRDSSKPKEKACTSNGRPFLVTSLVINLGLLAFFKYYAFLIDSMDVATGGIAASTGMSEFARSIVLPVGISFYTFQTMSYTIDVYRKSIPAEASFRKVALYVAYFPQLVAGPIIRSKDFFPSLKTRITFDNQRLVSGYHLVMVGIVKKVLIADNAARISDNIFATPEGLPSLAIWLGAFAFAIQIYCDFSGYTDIARGVSRILGIEIPINFDGPYLATSIISFWRKWHISLSTWLRDYLYIPLGGNRGGGIARQRNLLTTMLLGGLWHGASWNFVAWGGYQGLLLSSNHCLKSYIGKRDWLKRSVESPLGRLACWAFTMYLVLLGWIMFRVTNAADLLYCVKKFVLFDCKISLSGLGLGNNMPFIALLAIGVFCVLHAMRLFKTNIPDLLDHPRSQLIRPFVYVAVGFVMFFFWPSERTPFVYFQF